KLAVLDEGTFWLSENPETPGKGWDAALPRICTWGKFKDKQQGTVFYFFNLHLDHVGVKARHESAKQVLRRIKPLAAQGIPVILTGDFNVDQQSESYKEIVNSGFILDSYDTALLKYGASGTFNGFNIHSRTDSRIDHVFITKGITVEKHGVLTDFYQPAHSSKRADSRNFPKEVKLYENINRLPSDHFPVSVQLILKP